MKVQVTKDAFGVVVWPESEEIVYINPFADPDTGEEKGVSSWLRKKFTWSQKNYQIMTSKDVRKFMPDLGKDMSEGDIKIMELTIS